MRLPRGEDAVIPDGKVEAYCLNVDHRRGGAKARVFAAALGMTVRDVDRLKAALRLAARTTEAEVLFEDEYGVRYRIDFTLRNGALERTIRSGWIVRQPGDAPYLTTAFVLRSPHG